MATIYAQETIEKAIIGKRIVGVDWGPVLGVDGLFVLNSLTLEGGAKLILQVEDFEEIVIAEIEENDHADA